MRCIVYGGAFPSRVTSSLGGASSRLRAMVRTESTDSLLKPVAKQKCFSIAPSSLPLITPRHCTAPRRSRISEALVETMRNRRVGRVLHATSGFVTVGHFRHLLIVAFADAKYKLALFALLC